jgi:hypothetical protein
MPMPLTSLEKELLSRIQDLEQEHALSNEQQARILCACVLAINVTENESKGDAVKAAITMDILREKIRDVLCALGGACPY